VLVFVDVDGSGNTSAVTVFETAMAALELLLRVDMLYAKLKSEDVSYNPMTEV